MSYRGSRSERFAPYPDRDRDRNRDRDRDRARKPRAPRAAGGKNKKPAENSPPGNGGKAAVRPSTRGRSFMPFLEEVRTPARQQLHFARGVLQNASCYHSYAASISSVVPSRFTCSSTLENENDALASIKATPGDNEISVRLLLPLAKDDELTFNSTGLLVTRVDGKSVCYGGVVKSGDLPDVIDSAKQLFSAQTGYDFSAVDEWDKVCQIDYEDNNGSSAYSSLYIMPATPLGSVVVKKLVETEEESYTAQVEVEEEEEVEEDGEEKDEEGNPIKVTVVKKIKKKVPEERTRSKTKELLTPMLLLYTSLMNSNSADDELPRAFDMFLEAVRHHSVNAIITFLQTKDKREEEANEQEQKNEEAKKNLAEALKTLETKRDKDFAAKKAELQKQWDDEDEGETLDEIEAKADGRSKLKKEMCKELFDKCDAEMAELRKTKVELKEITSGIDKTAFEAFKVLDSDGKSGRMSRETLVNAVLASNVDLCTWEAEAYFANLTDPVVYGDVCKVRSVKHTDDTDMAEAEAEAEVEIPEAAPVDEPMEEPAEEGQEEEAMEVEDDYSNLSYRELQAACKDKGLSCQGKASVLRDRLRENAENQ